MTKDTSRLPCRLLILVEDYPSRRSLYAGAYVHTRVRQYVGQGYRCTVLSFRAGRCYAFEGVRVVTARVARKRLREGVYDVVVSHAPNVRNHVQFLLANRRFLPALCFFFHGHELLKTSRYYPRPFGYDRTGLARRLVQHAYDPVKLALMRRFLLWAVAGRPTGLVFVSRWMLDESMRCLRLGPRAEAVLLRASEVIPNAVGDVFLRRRHRRPARPVADFVTIRPFDSPKYAVDVVAKLAVANPRLRFDVYGKGRYFRHHEAPANLRVREGFVAHVAMPATLDSYTAALLPTRLDAQGVLMCELACYGMPLVTSDLPVCRETLSGFPNVAFISNSRGCADLAALASGLRQQPPAAVRARFGFEHTVAREMQLFDRLRGSRRRKVEP